MTPVRVLHRSRDRVFALSTERLPVVWPGQFCVDVRKEDAGSVQSGVVQQRIRRAVQQDVLLLWSYFGVDVLIGTSRAYVLLGEARCAR